MDGGAEASCSSVYPSTSRGDGGASLTPEKKGKTKSPRKSPISFLSGGGNKKRKLLTRGETEGGGSSRNKGLSVDEPACLSQPASPSLSGRLGNRMTKILSRSDANLMHSLKAKRHRNDSGGSAASGRDTPSRMSTDTPMDDDRDGSPSRAASFMVKATTYVAHLKSRLGKQRERVKNNEENNEDDEGETGDHHHHPLSRSRQSFSSCCGYRQGIDSSDTLDLAAKGGIINATTSTSSAGVSSTAPRNTTAGEAFSTATTSGHPSSTVGGGGQGSLSEESPSISVNAGTSTSAPTTTGKGETGTTTAGMAPQFPFYTMTVHLQRGKNLVARDACGSSDPYVKVKIGDKLHYKSKTINRDLNPMWDESFVLPISDLNQQIIFKVFDYDWGMQDDFMGMTSLDPSRVPPNKLTDLTLVLTETNTPGTDHMGELYIGVTLVPRTIEEKEIWISGDGQTGRLVDAQKRLKSQIWSSVLTILLLESKNLSPGDEPYVMDAFVKFRLGNQKYKSRTIQRTTYPKWVEQFDFYLYEGQPQILEIQVYDEAFSREYVGRVAIDIGLLEKEMTHHKTLQLQEGSGDISFLLTVSGTSGAESISDLSHHNLSPEERVEIGSRYALSGSFTSLKDVGYLTVKIYEAQGLAALDIGGKSDPFCVLELVNARLQTQTEYRTLNPIWNKIFTFAVKDITNILEITVYDEDKNHKQEFLGKLNIPLWKIKNGEKKWYMLKDRKLLRTAQGNNPKILMEMDLVWNPIRAGIRVMDPPEPKFLVPDQRLKREVFLLNIDRLKKIGVSLYDVVQYVESCMEWQYPLRSVIALATYEIVCYTFQPYMLPLLLLLFMLRQWFSASFTGKPILDEEIGSVDENMILEDDDDDTKDEDDKKMTLRQKLQAVQDATQTIQNVLGDIASVFESARNTFRMTVPFISWLVVIALTIGTVILYFIPVRYLAMAYGFHKFFRPILRPNVVPTNEAYNLVQRVPDNLQLVYYRPLRPGASPKSSTSERNRSPPAEKGMKGRPSTSVGESGSSGGKEQKKKYKFW